MPCYDGVPLFYKQLAFDSGTWPAYSPCPLRVQCTTMGSFRALSAYPLSPDARAGVYEFTTEIFTSAPSALSSPQSAAPRPALLVPR